MKDDDKPKTEAGVDVPLADQTPVAEDKIGPAAAVKPELGAASPFTRDVSAEEITPKDSSTVPDPAPSLAPAPEKIVEFDPEPVAVAAPAQKRGAAGGFIALLLGGAVAALGGFALSHYNLLELRAELDGPAFESRLAALETAQDALQSEIAATQGLAKAAEGKAIAASDAASQNPVSAEISALNARIDALDQALQAAGQSTEGGASAAALAALSAEVQALKSRPAADPAASEAATRALVDEALKAWENDAAGRAAAEAQSAKEAALADAAKQALAQAIDTGAPYQAALTAIGVQDVPPALAQYAETGLPTLAALQDSFADAARAGLEAALKTGGSGNDSVWTFLRVQTGARSLTPQEGSDPDAVLSRAEAALQAGNLDQALGELAALPPEGQSAMADWIAAAKTRSDAAKALAPLIAAP